jgi:hypothetical protein
MSESRVARNLVFGGRGFLFTRHVKLTYITIVAYLQGIRKSKSKLGNLERFMQKQKNFSLQTRQKQTYAPGELVLTNLIFREKPTEVRRIAICHPPFVIWCSSLL